MSRLFFLLILLGGGYWAITHYGVVELDDAVSLVSDSAHNKAVTGVIETYRDAWERGDVELLRSTINEQIVYAAPGERLEHEAFLHAFEQHHSTHTDTRIYLNTIVVDGDDVAVEWQFAATDKETGIRTAVSSANMVTVVDEKITVWKQYSDSRIPHMQAADALPIEEGEESFPSPNGSLRPYCAVACNL